MPNAKFDAKSFNPEAFGYMVQRVPNLTMNELKKSRALSSNPDISKVFANQDGTAYARLAMRGLIDGDAVNYDGSTDITATSTKTFEQGVVVIGRAKAWVERDFSYDITGGVDFMKNIAEQVAQYKDTLDQDTILSILKGIFSMTGVKNLEFVNTHTTEVAGTITPTTLNSATNKACGANKGKFTLVFMHSDVATNLENLNLLEYLKYTDKDGVTRDLGLATWNGRLVIIDDDMPVVSVPASDAVSAVTGVKGKYTITITTKAVAEDALGITVGGVTKTYICGVTPGWAAGANVAADCTALQALLAADFPAYNVTKTTTTVVLEQKVAKAEDAAVIVVNKKDSTGTLDAAVVETTEGVTAVAAKAAVEAHTEYTTYVLGNGAIAFEDIGAKVPYEMARDPKTNGGQDTLYMRQRKVFAPFGLSYEKKNQASLSPTNAELENGANWDLVHSGETVAANRSYINHKAIPIARIISRG
jgi:hypothetical protein